SPGIWARRTLPLIESSDCVIDGLRSMAELEVFRDGFGTSLLLVAILSSPDTRYQRLVARGREDDILSREEFDRREQREIAWGIGDLIELADVGIENEGSLEDFRRATEEFLGGLKG
ncbi:MAG: dephospho-CoA kinase, partial [Thermoplasmata archaeon]